MERGIVIGQGLRFLRAELPGILAAARGGALSPRMLRLVEDLARRPL
jgi:transposase